MKNNSFLNMIIGDFFILISIVKFINNTENYIFFSITFLVGISLINSYLSSLPILESIFFHTLNFSCCYLVTGPRLLEPLFFTYLFILVYQIIRIATSETNYKKKSFERKTKTSSGRNFSQNLHYVIQLRTLIQDESPVNILSGILSSISIHIAKIDGVISEKEIQALKNSINRNFQNIIDHSFIANIVGITKVHLNKIGHAGILSSLIDIIDLYFELIGNLNREEKYEFKILLFTIIYEVGIADNGRLSFEEAIILKGLYDHYSIPLEQQEVIRRSAEYNYNFGTRAKDYEKSSNEKLKESLKLFDLSENYSKEDLEKAWKKFVFTYHPDKHHSASNEIREMMNRKFTEGKEVYDFLASRV
ncbi:MAG: hypothetical protein SFU98_14885 [Leptospiraceae bacterium]|nr:hypothetical protein [Leptospiraceae bacterium]